jgi:hypothetical protein
MNKDKDIKNYNDKGKEHGYQEWWRYIDSTIQLRGNMKNGDCIGYVEDHMPMKMTEFYIR